MSKVYRDGDPKWLSRRLADHLTIGPDGMTPADRWLAGHESEGLLDVSISSGTPVSITPPYLGDAHTFVLELLTQEVLASLAMSLAADTDTRPALRTDGPVATAESVSTAVDGDDGRTDETPWATFVESGRPSAPLVGPKVH